MFILTAKVHSYKEHCKRVETLTKTYEVVVIQPAKFLESVKPIGRILHGGGDFRRYI